MMKKTLIVATTATSVLCALEPLSMLGATDQGWLPGEQQFLVATFIALLVTTLLLWARVRWAPIPALMANVVFGCYLGWIVVGTIRDQNYSGPLILVFLILMGLWPFLAAVTIGFWGSEFCRQKTNVPSRGL